MSRWVRTMSVVGAILIAFALGRAAFDVARGGADPAGVIDFVLLSVPGVVLWYVAHWLPQSELDEALYPRVLAWSLGGVAAMFVFILLRVAHPGVTVDWSLGTQAIAVAIGSVGGLAIGIREAEAITRGDELAARNEELAARERELARQNERLDEFTSIVSHDLRNPLNVAEGHLELARRGGDSEHLRQVAEAHERMEALIEDMLSLAQRGESIDDLEPVALADLVAACWENVATADATLDVAATCVVLADEARLRQLLENLLRNAVEHGGDDVTVTLDALESGDGFFVADDGPGIPEAERGSVLEHGYSSSQDGTGFGLAIVEQISDAHGWTVTVAGSETGGARFEFADVVLVEDRSAGDEALDRASPPG